ncbi:integrase catalytic domain-containing protein [Trichonephila clavipes]|nr:integrase catalytic domain-containing protein [Trichonephila clavipes]
MGLKIPSKAKIIDLKTLIESSAVYKNDIEFVRSLVENALEKSKQEAEKNEREAEIQLEKIKLSQIEKQLELAKVRKESEKNSQSLESGEPSSITHKLESLVKSIKTLTIQVPVRSESFNLFFHFLEKAFQIKSVPDDLKAEILLNILGERVNNLLTYVSQEDLSNYVKIKELILREFEPTPQECLSNFKKARKLPSENYVQFASRLSATFDYYFQLRKVNEFRSLCDLIISDKIFETLDRDTMNHIATKQGETYFKPQQLGRECDVYLSARGKVSNDLMSRNPGSGVKTDGRNRLTMVSTGRQERNSSNVFVAETKTKLCSILKEYRSEKNCFCLRPHNSLIHFSRDKTRNPTPTSNLNLDAPTFVPGQIEGSVEANSQSQFVATGYVVSMALNKESVLFTTERGGRMFMLVAKTVRQTVWSVYLQLLCVKLLQPKAVTMPTAAVDVIPDPMIDSMKLHVTKDEKEERGSWSNGIEFLLSCLSYAVGSHLELSSEYVTFSNRTGIFKKKKIVAMTFAPTLVYIHWCAKIKDEVEKLAYQLNEEAERTERPIRRLRTAIRGFSSGRPRGTTPADDRYIVLQDRRQAAGEIARHTTQATGRPISRFTVARRLHGGGLFARHPVRCVPLTPAHRRRRFLCCREHRNWRDNEWGRVLFTDESRFSLSSDSHRILIWRERGGRNHPSNIIERDRGAMGLQFLFMDDNAPCHRTVAAEQLLESRRLAARTLPPVTIRELRLALQDEWAALPQQLIDTLILSMGRRCETCLAVKGDHIPY